MLERASSCLETGGRQLLRAPKRCPHSYRMLSSTFWYHGAKDQALPARWAPCTSSDYDSGNVGSHHPSPPDATRTFDRPLLDFLYPEKTLALLKRISTRGCDAVGTRRNVPHIPGIRPFSSLRWQPGENKVTDDPEVIEAREGMKILLLTKTPEEALNALLKTRQPGKQALAWALFSKISESGQVLDHAKQQNLLAYMAEGTISWAASPLLQIFHSIPPEQRRASSYRAAVSAYVALKMVGPAIQLLEEAAARFDSPYIGTAAVLKQTIRDDQWDLSLRVFRTALGQAKRNGVDMSKWTHRSNETDFDAIWGQVEQLPDLPEHLQSLLSHVRQFSHDLNSTDEAKNTLELFMNGFVVPVMEQVLHDSRLGQTYTWDFFINIFRDLASLSIQPSELYEYAISTMLKMKRYRQYTNQRKVHLELYRRYREQYKLGTARPPSRYLISRLIHQHGQMDSMERVEDMVKDLEDWHADSPFTPATLKFLVQLHARHGNADKVHHYVDEILARFPDNVDLQTLQSLVYVYARRVDVAGALAQFRRLATDFGQEPNLSCWNALLLAFVRADDLDGALQCFNNCLDSSITPNIFTFGPMLDLCADRGDIEAFEALYSRAQQLKIPVENDRRARSSYVQAFLNAGDVEGARRILEGIVHSWQAGALRGQSITHPWNLLLTWHALRGDLSGSRQLYKQMTELQVPLDSWTYSALMRALVQSRNTDAAYKMLTVTMPLNNIRVYAFHYAIVISGFLQERQHAKAERARRRMQSRHVPATESSRQASLSSVGVNELKKILSERPENAKQRLQETEEKLRESLLADYGSEIAHDQPSHKRYIDSQELSNVPQGYFSLIILLYNAVGAYDICRQLFEAASKAKTGNEVYEAPIALLTAIMETHLKTGDHEEMERCWSLAQSEASRLVKTFQQAMEPDASPKQFDSLVDPRLMETFESSRIAANRRQILFRATRYYIRSLIVQDTPEALQKAQRTIHDLLVAGFVIDNVTWNEFIAHLALRGHIIDAFSACEMYLMPGFPGWVEFNPTYWRKYRPGYQWTDLRVHDIKRNSRIPRYKTLVVLAAAWAQVGRDEANGLGYNPELGGWARETLERIAPKTVRALESMPRTGDELQRQYLGE